MRTWNLLKTDWLWTMFVGLAAVIVIGALGLAVYVQTVSAENELTRIYYTDKVFIDDGVVPPGFYPRVDAVLQPGEGFNVILSGDSWYILEITATKVRHQAKFETTVSKIANDLAGARSGIAVAAKYSGIRDKLQACWQFAKDNGMNPPGDPVNLLGSEISC